MAQREVGIWLINTTKPVRKLGIAVKDPLARTHKSNKESLKKVDSPALEHTILGSSIVVAAKDQVCADLAGEVAILDLKSGMYYGLDEVGARVWSLIQQPRTVNEIRDAILEEYEVEPDRCERDIVALLEQLVGARLIEIRDETPA